MVFFSPGKLPVPMYIENKPRQVALILSASLAGFMALLDGNIVNISLPSIALYFHVGTGSVVRIILVYMVVMAGSMIIFGKLADKYGVKKVFISGFVIFTLSSLLCGFADSMNMLLSARAMQALGASMLYSTGISLISRFIPPDRRGWAFGIFSPMVSLGLLVGNPLGGLITGFLNWHWIFLINVPVGILAVILALKAIPDEKNSRGKDTRGSFDFAGAFLSFAGLSLLVFCLNQAHKVGWNSPVMFIGLPASLLLLVLFVLRERKAVDPILDLSIFRRRDFSTGMIISLTGYGLLAGSGILMPFLLTYILKINVEHAGFILMTFAVVFSAMSPVAGNLSDHISKTRLMLTGMSLAVAASLFFILFMGHMHLWVVFMFLVLQGVAYAFFITPNNNFIMSVVDPDKQSISSSVFKLSTNLGQMTGIILMEFLFSAAMPAGFRADSAHATSLTPETLSSGFSLAYAGGAGLCLVALLLTAMLKDRKIRAQVIGESTTLI
jgi:EmrB/QacA subfamily drug resistance transporter